MKGTFIIDSIIVFVWRDETSTSTDFAREWGSMIPRSGNHDPKKGKRIHWSYVIFFTHGNTDTKYYMPPTYMEHIACVAINIWVCSPLNHQSIHTHTHTLVQKLRHQVPKSWKKMLLCKCKPTAWNRKTKRPTEHLLITMKFISKAGTWFQRPRIISLWLQKRLRWLETSESYSNPLQYWK